MMMRLRLIVGAEEVESPRMEWRKLELQEERWKESWENEARFWFRWIGKTTEKSKVTDRLEIGSLSPTFSSLKSQQTQLRTLFSH